MGFPAYSGNVAKGGGATKLAPVDVPEGRTIFPRYRGSRISIRLINHTGVNRI